MAINYDEKGKYYTDVISKVAVEARIQTTTHFIEGKIHIRNDFRLKDELDRDEPFLAITDAGIFNPDHLLLFRTQFIAEFGRVISDHLLLFRTQFIAVRREQVIWITTEQDIEKGES